MTPLDPTASRQNYEATHEGKYRKPFSVAHSAGRVGVLHPAAPVKSGLSARPVTRQVSHR